MGRRKVYGQSRKDICALCGKQATAKNAQEIPVCREHTEADIEMRCMCGQWLDVRESKYGTFFLCMDCGPVSYSKALEVNDLPAVRLEDL